jgi:crossover junction endodeoxyribonuclease RuvC
MFDSCVLGVDPGVASVGLAAMARREGSPVVVWSDTVMTAAALAEASRLREIYRAVRDAITQQRPDAVAVERLMWGRNTGSAMKVSRASGVILLAAADAGLPVEEYAPLEIKMAVTGVGNADKAQVRRALERTHRIEGIPTQPDAADAAAVAFCHLQQARLRAATKEALAR